MFQAYIDDSSTEDGVFVIAGYVATAEVWAQFVRDWEEMLPYGIRDKRGFYFKMSEICINNERIERVPAFYRVIDRHPLLGISCKINMVDLRKAISRIWSLNRSIDWGPYSDPYIFTFRALIDCVHAHRGKIPQLPDEKIDFIFDQQSQGKRILLAWDNFLSTRKEEVRSRFGAHPRFEDDRDFLPLQAADLWAWRIREWYEMQDGLQIREDVGNLLITLSNIDRKNDQNTGAIQITYNEDQIAENLLFLANSTYPDAIVYDSAYRGER